MAEPASMPQTVALEDRDHSRDGRQFSPSAARNSEPIRAVLAGILPKTGPVLEIASGTGEHVVYFAEAFPHLVFQPSDPDPSSRVSIASWIEVEELGNVRPPAAIDVRESLWGVEDVGPYGAILCLNMIHIAPWDAARGLIAGAGRLLRDGGILYLYGPFKQGGIHTAPSNAAFDADLKRRDPGWGVRDIDDLVAEAARHGLELADVVDMPANNRSLVFAKADSLATREAS